MYAYYALNVCGGSRAWNVIKTSEHVYKVRITTQFAINFLLSLLRQCNGSYGRRSHFECLSLQPMVRVSSVECRPPYNVGYLLSTKITVKVGVLSVVNGPRRLPG